MMILVAAAALIDLDGRILVTSRPEGRDYAGCWEFPGGKVEAEETLEEAIVRELAEELSVQTEESCLAPFSFGTQDEDDRSLVIHLFLCRKWRGTPHPQEGQKMQWARPASLLDLNMPPIDRPLAAQLRDYLLG